jgi:hypothetical protein
MSNQTTIKPKCQICGHIIANNSIPKLSSIEFRRYLNSITDLDKLIESKDYFVRFIKSHYRNKEYIDKFLEDLEKIIEDHNHIADIDYIRIWIYNYISLIESYDLDREKQLYKFLQSNYSDINETFTIFYENYIQNIAQNPLNKNRVSRALSALGLKTIMKKIAIDNKAKSAIMVIATENELVELLYKNAI